MFCFSIKTVLRYSISFVPLFTQCTQHCRHIDTWTVLIHNLGYYNTTKRSTRLWILLLHRYWRGTVVMHLITVKKKAWVFWDALIQHDANCPLSLMWHLASFHSTVSHLVLSCLKYFESPTQTFGNCPLLITCPSGP